MALDTNLQENLQGRAGSFCCFLLSETNFLPVHTDVLDVLIKVCCSVYFYVLYMYMISVSSGLVLGHVMSML